MTDPGELSSRTKIPSEKDIHVNKIASRFQSPFAKREGVDYKWSGLTYVENQKKKRIPILNDVWGHVPAGKVCCILGPSGAGKSSLLNILAGRKKNGGSAEIEGVITVNGVQTSPSKFKTNIAYVMQEDALFPTLSPREAIRFSAALRIPTTVSAEQKESLVTTMLLELGLERCADTFIGGALLKGISGGEKKRTAVGVELVTNPALVFLDEPTSGLDSFSAFQCVSVLKKVAAAGSGVLCTIHQPSSEVFNCFDNCILMKNGYIVYQGPVTEVADFFSGGGYPVPVNYNTADHAINIIQTNSVDELKSKQLLLPAPEHKAHQKLDTEQPMLRFRVPLTLQTRWLVWREFAGMYRDIPALIGRFAITAFLGLLFGIIFQDSGNRDDSISTNATTHFGALTFLSINAMFGTAQPALLAFPFERPIFLREYSTGTYSVIPYFITKVIAEMVLAFAQNLLLVILTYFLMGLNGNFILIVLALWMLGLASTSVAIVLGCYVTDPKGAAEAAPVLFVPQILFAGFFIRIQQIPVWLRWAQYLCGLKYALNLIVLIEFSDCPSAAQANCDEILDNNDIDEDIWFVYGIILIAIFIILRSLGLFLLTYRAKKFF